MIVEVAVVVAFDSKPFGSTFLLLSEKRAYLKVVEEEMMKQEMKKENYLGKT